MRFKCSVASAAQQAVEALVARRRDLHRRASRRNLLLPAFLMRPLLNGGTLGGRQNAAPFSVSEDLVVSDPNVARLERLVELSERARSAGRDMVLLQWWRALAELVLTLAARTRGWHVKVDRHWLAIVPPDSICVRLSRAYSLADTVPLSHEMRVELSSLSETGSAEDAVARATRALALASLESAHVEHAPTSDTSRVLLESVLAVAAEFEARGLRQDPMPTPREGEPELDMSAFILLSPLVPRVGREVGAALDQCERLASGLG